ncbi:MAG TPA: type II secretion system protein [Chthoniobacter sp.]|jgi:prepilin-type N-terminal cleavage/methylation domain-containing protein
MFPSPPRSTPSSRVRLAFTLIELLLVISIIAILVAILFPVLGMVRSRMDSAQCLSQLRQIGAGVSAYVNDHNATLPGPLSFEQSAVYTPGQPGSLAALLESYLGTASTIAPDGVNHYSPLFECPAAARKLHDPTKPTYLVNFLPLPEQGQPIWGDVTQNQQPLSFTALTNWSDATTGGTPLSLSETWAIQDGDQNYVSEVNMYSGSVNDLLPTQAHGDHWNDLFFDFHAASRNTLISVESPQGPSGTPAPTGSAGSAGSPSSP